MEGIQGRVVFVVLVVLTAVNVMLLVRRADAWIADAGRVQAPPPGLDLTLQQAVGAPERQIVPQEPGAPAPPGSPPEPTTAGPSQADPANRPAGSPVYEELALEDVLHDLAAALNGGGLMLGTADRARLRGLLESAEPGQRRRAATRVETMALLYATLRPEQWTTLQRMRGQLTEWAYIDLPSISTRLPEPGEDRALTALIELLESRDVEPGALPPAAGLPQPPEPLGLREAVRGLLRLQQERVLGLDGTQAPIVLTLARRARDLLSEDYEARMVILEGLSPGQRAIVERMRRADYTAPMAAARTAPSDVLKLLTP